MSDASADPARRAGAAANPGSPAGAVAAVRGQPPAGRERGLTAREAAERLRRDGPNRVPRPRPPSPLRQLAGQLTHFFALLLWVAALLALVAGMPQLTGAIAAVVILNGVFAFAQEYRADRATARLADLLPASARVLRDGAVHVVDASQLVVDDLVLLEAGDRVSADIRLLHAEGLAVDESMLTGESTVVRPDAGNVVHAGTFVVEGAARGLVKATGGRTRLATIAALTRATRRPPSPLSLQLHRVVRAVAVMAVGTGVVAFGISLALGTDTTQGFLFGVGVTVALVPEGLLPTVTLSLARAAQRMAGRNALVRRLESVETLGSTTFICTDKTGTLTRNEMNVVHVWMPAGEVSISGEGYSPEGRLEGTTAARAAATRLVESAAVCVHGRAVLEQGVWRPHGDPMEVALYVLAERCGLPTDRVRRHEAARSFPFDPRRRRSSVVVDGTLHVIGAPDAVLPRCRGADVTSSRSIAVEQMSEAGLRVLAVGTRALPVELANASVDEVERDLEFLGLVGLQDPLREGVAAAIASCRAAGIRLAMVTGDHPGTARAIARQVGLLGRHDLVIEGVDLPGNDGELGALLDRDGVVVARVTPEDKLRIARALQARGHVVAMTGDGVNDGPALREADIGVAMGAGGTDVAREAADLVLLDDSFETIVAAVELGRTTFANIRRFLTYHLTDNVAELTPFLVWSLSAGQVPLALGVLQILALDIGTDLLPALALGAEPPNPRVLEGPMRTDRLLDGRLVRRAFGVLGPSEAVVEMVAFVAVLVAGGWVLGAEPSSGLLAVASGTAFTAVVLGQLANAFACRSESRWVGALQWRGNPLLFWAVASELVILAVFLGVPPLARLLGGSPPNLTGWLLAACAVPAVILADTAQKAARAAGHRSRARRSGS